MTQTHCKTTDRQQTREEDWLMEPNPAKCEVIRITNRKKTKIVTNYSIHKLNSVLE